MNSWWLVLLFWNPTIEAYDVANGWSPLPMPSQEFCQGKLEFAQANIHRYVVDPNFTINCVEAEDQQEAVAKVLG